MSEAVTTPAWYDVSGQWASLVADYNSLAAYYAKFQGLLVGGSLSPALADQVQTEISFWPTVQGWLDQATALVSPNDSTGELGLVPLIVGAAVLVVLAGAAAYISNRLTASKSLDLQIQAEQNSAVAAGGLPAQIGQTIKDITTAGGSTLPWVAIGIVALVGGLIWLKK